MKQKHMKASVILNIISSLCNRQTASPHNNIQKLSAKHVFTSIPCCNVASWILLSGFWESVQAIILCGVSVLLSSSLRSSLFSRASRSYSALRAFKYLWNGASPMVMAAAAKEECCVHRRGLRFSLLGLAMMPHPPSDSWEPHLYSQRTMKKL